MHNLQEIHKFQRAIPHTGGGEMGEGVWAYVQTLM